MSDPTLTIRVQYKQEGKTQYARTLDIAVRPMADAGELADRAGRRVRATVEEILEDVAEDAKLAAPA